MVFVSAPVGGQIERVNLDVKDVSAKKGKLVKPVRVLPKGLCLIALMEDKHLVWDLLDCNDNGSVEFRKGI